ncbi:MAG TPA: hypothetical protein PLN56_10905 [Methanoregulaceae archaeon]|nr:hypothetical protein [Methanoregulaceae archaeon]
MAKLNEEGQWIILMGFIISITILILALIIAESSLVGKTTSESVLEFPKTDIQDLRSLIFQLKSNNWNDLINPDYRQDIQTLFSERKNAIVFYYNDSRILYIHYNNGITSYNEIHEEK